MSSPFPQCLSFKRAADGGRSPLGDIDYWFREVLFHMSTQFSKQGLTTLKSTMLDWLAVSTVVSF